jgi:tRNA(fMet)-specific endonuclease VapC
MNPVVCDTNVFVHFFIGDDKTKSNISSIGEDNLLVPSIVLMELIRGCGDKKALAIIESRMKRYTVFHLDELISQKALELLRNYHLSHGLNIPDAFIAAFAVVHDIELFTYNLKDFRFIPGIRLFQSK